jgi:hypothetical protein
MDISNRGLFDSIILNSTVGTEKIENANPTEVRTALASYTQRRFACSQCQASQFEPSTKCCCYAMEPFRQNSRVSAEGID